MSDDRVHIGVLRHADQWGCGAKCLVASIGSAVLTSMPLWFPRPAGRLDASDFAYPFVISWLWVYFVFRYVGKSDHQESQCRLIGSRIGSENINLNLDEVPHCLVSRNVLGIQIGKSGVAVRLPRGLIAEFYEFDSEMLSQELQERGSGYAGDYTYRALITISMTTIFSFIAPFGAAIAVHGRVSLGDLFISVWLAFCALCESRRLHGHFLCFSLRDRVNLGVLYIGGIVCYAMYKGFDYAFCVVVAEGAYAFYRIVQIIRVNEARALEVKSLRTLCDND